MKYPHDMGYNELMVVTVSPNANPAWRRKCRKVALFKVLVTLHEMRAEETSPDRVVALVESMVALENLLDGTP